MCNYCVTPTHRVSIQTFRLRTHYNISLVCVVCCSGGEECETKATRSVRTRGGPNKPIGSDVWLGVWHMRRMTSVGFMVFVSCVISPYIAHPQTLESLASVFATESWSGIIIVVWCTPGLFVSIHVGHCRLFLLCVSAASNVTCFPATPWLVTMAASDIWRLQRSTTRTNGFRCIACHAVEAGEIHVSTMA